MGSTAGRDGNRRTVAWGAGPWEPPVCSDPPPDQGRLCLLPDPPPPDQRPVPNRGQWKAPARIPVSPSWRSPMSPRSAPWRRGALPGAGKRQDGSWEMSSCLVCDNAVGCPARQRTQCEDHCQEREREERDGLWRAALEQESLARLCGTPFLPWIEGVDSRPM